MNQTQTQNERRKQIDRLISESTPAERHKIWIGRPEGQQLRRRVERLRRWDA